MRENMNQSRENRTLQAMPSWCFCCRRDKAGRTASRGPGQDRNLTGDRESVPSACRGGRRQRLSPDISAVPDPIVLRGEQ
ncbi:hypothetical protein GN956_G16719 [Arapaima gigas]